MSHAFAIWLTGLPASGKSAIAHVLRERLAEAGLTVEVLESDAMRRTVTPQPTYGREERDLFYRAMVFCAGRLVAHGVPVVIDATGNRRAYRDLARNLIRHFVEVAVTCPLEVCQERDRKGIYQGGLRGRSSTVPGLQDPYEPPLKPELEVDTVRTRPEEAADRIMMWLRARGYLAGARAVE